MKDNFVTADPSPCPLVNASPARLSRQAPAGWAGLPVPGQAVTSNYASDIGTCFYAAPSLIMRGQSGEELWTEKY